MLSGALKPLALMAQSSNQEDLQQLVQGAAREIEDGNLERARRILNEASASDSVTEDVADLIASLRETISDIENSQNPDGQDPSEPRQFEPGKKASMSEQDLKQYLDELSIAVRQLFSSETGQ